MAVPPFLAEFLFRKTLLRVRVLETHEYLVIVLRIDRLLSLEWDSGLNILNTSALLVESRESIVMMFSFYL